tara:strand:+ start:1993 stop:2703 length:711 start_codon:yes stop_codon:yes gene_type:complete
MINKKQFEEDKYIDSQCVIIIPAYNEENSILSVLKDISQYFSNIIVIDDGSIDKTVEEASKFKKFKLLKHFINCGQGVSILTGIRFFLKKTNFKYLITFDADGQHNAADAYKMAKFAIKNKHQVVFGSRFLSKKNIYIPLYRKLFLKLAIIFERLIFKFKLTDSHNGLRFLDKKACKLLLEISSSKMAHATEIPLKLFSNGINIHEYPCEINYKIAKNSTSIFSSANIISDLIQKK